METSWYSLFDLDPDDTLEVRAGDMQEFMRQQMMGAINPGLVVTTQEERKAQEALQPELDDDEVFCTIRWSRADIVDAIENACGVRLDRDIDNPTAAKEIIDRVIDAVTNNLEDRSIERGWEVIDTLMPQDAVDRTLEIYDRCRDKASVSLNEEAWATQVAARVLDSNNDHRVVSQERS